jgi:hypothetical protein
MKKTAVTAVLLFLVLFAGFSVPNDVIYSEGDATVKFQEGYVEDVYIGDVYDTGDTITTGYDGFVELDQEGLMLKINPDTVFTLQEKEEKGEKTGVFSLALGSIKFRYDRITGKEPMIQAPSCVAGVRGTEFSVFAGADGSALIVVDSGQVEVESEGQVVQLAADEGVEVPLGGPPGDKFRVPDEKIDYRSWNEEKLTKLLDDPILSISQISERLESYIENVTKYKAMHTEYSSRLADERKRLPERAEKEGKEAARKYSQEVIDPLSIQTFNLFLNVRYYSLAALSLRRYVGGRLYSFVKAANIANPENKVFMDYLLLHKKILNSFETSIVPYLVEADI